MGTGPDPAGGVAEAAGSDGGTLVRNLLPQRPLLFAVGVDVAGEGGGDVRVELRGGAALDLGDGRLALGASDRVLGRPKESTILGATKLTGKGAGWTYGVLTALTSREYADVETSSVGADGVAVLARALPGIREIVTEAGFTRFRSAAETPFNRVLEVRP